MSTGDYIDEILEQGENLEFRVTLNKDNYDIRARFDYKGDKVDMLVESVDSKDELGRFYEENLSQLVSTSSNAVYGSSEPVRQRLAQKDTWAITGSGEWAVDARKAIMKHMKKGSYRDLIDHTSASALSAIVLSETHREERTEDYQFYLNTIRDLEPKEKSPGMVGKVKQRAKNKAKDKTKNTAKKALEDAEAEFRRMEEEGKIDEAKQKAKQKAREAMKKKISDTKNNTRKKAQDQLTTAKNRVSNLGGTVRTLSPLYTEKTDYEGPEPNAKIQKDNGVTIYFYGNDYQDYLKNRDED